MGETDQQVPTKICWEGRCVGAALRMNEGPEWGPTCLEKVTNSVSNQTYKAVSTNWTKQLTKDKKRKAREEVKLEMLKTIMTFNLVKDA